MSPIIYHQPRREIDTNTNRIPDPFIDANELSVRWIGKKDWIYRTTFQTPSLSLASGDKQITTDLVFYGLDTYATATLNGKTILTSENMHIKHRVDISHHLSRNGTENEHSLQVRPAAWSRTHYATSRTYIPRSPNRSQSRPCEESAV